jgi:hypothetical protein
MKFQSIKNRLREIAETRGAGTALLTFPDGSTRSLKIRDRNAALGLLLDCFRKARSFPPPAPADALKDPPPPEAKTENDRTIEIMGRAQSCEGDRLMQLIHEFATTIRKEKSCSRKCNEN